MTQFHGLPEGFQMGSPDKWLKTDNPLVLKPTTGAVGTQYVKFFILEIYSSKLSEEQKREVKVPVEMCAIQNDRFSTYCCMVKDLSRKQMIDLAGIYQRFKEQKDSKDTSVIDWEALTDRDKGFLLQAGVVSVEQLASFGEHDLYKLGPGGKEYRDMALRHVEGKAGKKRDEESGEMSALRREKDEQAIRLKALEEKFYAQEAEKAKKSQQAANARAAKKGKKAEVTEAAA